MGEQAPSVLALARHRIRIPRGRFRNHQLTAGALADAGFIVIPPQHSADHRIGNSATAGAVAVRIEALRVLIGGAV